MMLYSEGKNKNNFLQQLSKEVKMKWVYVLLLYCYSANNYASIQTREDKHDYNYNS